MSGKGGEPLRVLLHLLVIAVRSYYRLLRPVFILKIAQRKRNECRNCVIPVVCVELGKWYAVKHNCVT